MSRFDHRSHEQEIMDDLNCQGQVVDQTLTELEVINRLLGGNHVTLSGVAELIAHTPRDRTVSIIDIGCGGGDILKRLALWGRRNKTTFRLTGIDANPNIVAYAAAHATEYPEINFETADVTTKEFQSRECDVFIATLFMHHFSTEALTSMLRSMKKQAKVGIIINDIHRHPLAYHSIRWLTRILSKSSMVQNDAPLSVLRAFRKAELADILAKSGIEKYVLRWKWAFRWQLLIRTGDSPTR